MSRLLRSDDLLALVALAIIILVLLSLSSCTIRRELPDPTATPVLEIVAKTATPTVAAEEKNELRKLPELLQSTRTSNPRPRP
jgi:hypothetical protein